MAKCFSDKAVEVDYVFSGRPAEQYFDMEPFGEYRSFRGLTFASSNGRLSYTRTALSNNILRFANDVRALDTEPYDLILTDFEPLTAWAGKLRRRTVIGIGHQYAFGHAIPRAGDNFLSNLTMRLFAPAAVSLGLHWNDFESPILPPIINTELSHRFADESGLIDYDQATSIVVYLPFEDQARVQRELSAIKDQHFIIYSPALQDEEKGNLSLRKTQHSGFKQDLRSSRAVICNSGFELVSECLQLGLAVLTKPQFAQTEQLSNAAALEQLGYATTTNHISSDVVRQWLRDLRHQPAMQYPDVAEAITGWIISGRRQSPQQLADLLWSQTRTLQSTTAKGSTVSLERQAHAY